MAKDHQEQSDRKKIRSDRRKMRKCITCGAMFDSESEANRICPKHTSSNVTGTARGFNENAKPGNLSVKSLNARAMAAQQRKNRTP